MRIYPVDGSDPCSEAISSCARLAACQTTFSACDWREPLIKLSPDSKSMRYRLHGMTRDCCFAIWSMRQSYRSHDYDFRDCARGVL